MKRMALVAMLCLLALLFSGCQNKDSLEYIVGNESFFDLRVDAVLEGSIRGRSEKMGEVEVILGETLNNRSYTEMKAGDLVEVFYDGRVEEIYPLRIPGTRAIVLVQPADHIGTLRLSGLSAVRISEEPVISMDIVPGMLSPAGATLVIENLGRQDIEGQIAGEYLLQIEQQGAWYDLERSDPAMKKGTEIFQPGVPRRQDLDWSGIYGKLPDGHYRIVKRFTEALSEPGQFRTFYVAAEFTRDQRQDEKEAGN